MTFYYLLLSLPNKPQESFHKLPLVPAETTNWLHFCEYTFCISNVLHIFYRTVHQIIGRSVQNNISNNMIIFISRGDVASPQVSTPSLTLDNSGEDIADSPMPFQFTPGQSFLLILLKEIFYDTSSTMIH